jgi:FdrA protein
MITGYVIRKNEYHDSVFLMRVAKRLSDQEGILQAAVLMGTEKNKGLLAEIEVSGAGISAATPNDLILAVKAESEQSLSTVLGKIDQWLSPDADRAGKSTIRTLDEAMARQPHSNLAVISVPGAYAAREAQKALECGLNVFLFSDNVPVESERSLKEYARERGLIVMGPDCGTAIIGGVGRRLRQCRSARTHRCHRRFRYWDPGVHHACSPGWFRHLPCDWNRQPGSFR